MTKKILTSLGIGLVLTIASFFIVTTYSGVVGNGCGGAEEDWGALCYEPLIQAGAPFAYIQDSGVNSVVGQLHVLEDHVRGWAFFVDWIIYAAIVLGVRTLWKQKKHA